MGEMADFVNDGLMEEIFEEEDAARIRDYQALYDMGAIDEYGFPVQKRRRGDNVPPADPFRKKGILESG